MNNKEKVDLVKIRGIIGIIVFIGTIIFLKVYTIYRLLDDYINYIFIVLTIIVVVSLNYVREYLQTFLK